MKKEDFLKMGLDEYTAKKCADASAEELKAYIPKSRFDEVNHERKKLKADMQDKDNQLEALKNSINNMENLKKKLEILHNNSKAKDKKYAAERKQWKVNAAIEAALFSAKAKNGKAVRALLHIDMDNIKIREDGTLEGLYLEEQIKSLQNAEDSKFLFDTQERKIKGAYPGRSNKDFVSNWDTSK